MAQHNDFFTPEHIDDQIEHLQQVSQDTRDTPSQDVKTSNVISRLQQVYGREATGEAQSLMRVRHRVMQDYNTKQETRILSMRTRDTGNTETHLDTYDDYRKSSSGRTFAQRFGTFAAVVLVCLLVGSAAVVFYTARQGKSGHNTIVGSSPVKATPTVAPSGNTPTVPSSGHIGKTITTYQQDMGAYALTWSPDSTRIASTSNVVEEWNATTGRKILTYSPPSNVGATIQDVMWSPDGTRIASTGSSVQVWNANTGKVLVTFTPPSGQASSTTGTTSALSSTTNGTHIVYDTTLVSNTLLSGGPNITAVAWSPDSKYIASTNYINSSDYSVQVWNASTGTLVTKYTGHSFTVLALAWSPDGKYIASGGGDDTVQVWNAMTGKNIYTFRGHQGMVSNVAWSPDGKRIASSDYTGVVNVWDAFTGLHPYSFTGSPNGVPSATWSPDGTRIASSAGTKVELRDATNGKLLYTYNGNPNTVRTIAWSPNGKYIASGDVASETGTIGTVKVWLAS